jgi:hypothetical protein
MKKALVLSLLLIGCIKSKPEGADAGGGSANASPPPPMSAASVVPAAAASSSGAFSVTQCESLLVDAERQLHTARSRASAACKRDDDCQLIETSACVPACVDRAIARSAVTDYMKTREQLRQSSCKLWNDAECPRTTPKPKPECTPMKAVCKTGQCDVAPK